jgi:hypothetical protein
MGRSQNPAPALGCRRLILTMSPFAGLTYQIKNGPKTFKSGMHFGFSFSPLGTQCITLTKVGIYIYLFIYYYYYLFFQFSTLVNALGVRHSQNQCPSTLPQAGTSIENGLFPACSPIGTLPIVAKEYGNVFFFVERTFHPILYFGCSLKVIWIGGVLTNKGPT